MKEGKASVSVHSSAFFYVMIKNMKVSVFVYVGVGAGVGAHVAPNIRGASFQSISKICFLCQEQRGELA